MLNPVEWEHLSDALPDLQAALVSQNTNFQVRFLQPCVLITPSSFPIATCVWLPLPAVSDSLRSDSPGC